VFARHLIHMLIAKTRSLVKQVSRLALKDVYGALPSSSRQRDRAGRHARGAES